MNREALPLIGAICIPLVIVGAILLYTREMPIVTYLLQIKPIYYVITIPFVLGFIAAIILLRKMKKG